MTNKTFSLTVLIIIMLASAGMAQQPRMMRLERDDFLNEVLRDKPSPKTIYYDTGVQGSYQILKSDVLRGLPDTAKGQNIDLRGLLMIGPYGPTNVTFIYAFVNEKSMIRVNELTVAQGRFTYKSTGKLTPAQYESFWNGLLKANVLVSGLPSMATNESTYETILARWSNGNFDSYYGSMINPRPGANIKDFGKLIGDLLHSLTKTYPLNLHAQPRGTATTLKP